MQTWKNRSRFGSEVRPPILGDQLDASGRLSESFVLPLILAGLDHDPRGSNVDHQRQTDLVCYSCDTLGEVNGLIEIPRRVENHAAERQPPVRRDGSVVQGARRDVVDLVAFSVSQSHSAVIRRPVSFCTEALGCGDPFLGEFDRDGNIEVDSIPEGTWRGGVEPDAWIASQRIEQVVVLGVLLSQQRLPERRQRRLVLGVDAPLHVLGHRRIRP